MSTPEIRLDTIADFASLTAEQFERMLPDFIVWHAFNCHVKAAGLAYAVGFIWSDDGNAGVVGDVVILDPATGGTVHAKAVP